MALMRVVLACSLVVCALAGASPRSLLDDTNASSVTTSGTEDIEPVVPTLAMLTAPHGVVNKFLPANAASNPSVAAGFLLAPMLLQRNNGAAHLGAPTITPGGKVPPGLARLPPHVLNVLGFAADAASAKPPAGAPQAQRVVSAMAKPEGPKKGPVGRG